MTSATEWRLVVLGAPRTKKNHGRVIVRQLRGAPHKYHVPSAAWTAWSASATVRRLAPTPWQAPTGCVNVAALFYRDARRGDAVGYYQGLADLLEARHIVVNDRRLASWDGSRLLLDSQNPRVEIVLTAAADPEAA